MFQKLVLMLLLVTLTNAINTNESQCSENDIQCLSQKEEMHWCSDQGCSTCTDHNCVISCRGFSCGLCPNGSCCDGTNCNVCYNNTCCLTVACNYCIHTCKRVCNNVSTCEKVCVPQCRNSKVDIFVIPSSTHKQEATVYIKGLPYHGDLTSGNFNKLDKTILVSIDGKDRYATIVTLWEQPKNITRNCTINNVNLCSKENVTKCLKECDLKCETDCKKHCTPNCSKPKPQEDSNYYNTLVPGCCHVVHPRICYNSYAQPFCYKRSHRECSNLCTSKFVHITSITGYYPFQYNQCFYIQAYPYVYCGQYVTQNCDSCYVCNGKYNPSQCINGFLCNNECRKNFLPYQPQKLQNKKTKTSCSNTVQTQNGFGYFSNYGRSIGIPLNYG